MSAPVDAQKETSSMIFDDAPDILRRFDKHPAARVQEAVFVAFLWTALYKLDSLAPQLTTWRAANPAGSSLEVRGPRGR
jgi:hypothetical protein